MGHPRIKVGIGVGTQPPLYQTKALVRAARTFGMDSLWTVDHFQSWFPRDLWTKDFTWFAGERSPHAFFDYQVLMGHIAKSVGNAQLAVGVTEVLRRHPLVVAQAFLSLSHLTKRPPILGLGSGEAENVVPYGIDFTRPVARLEEALQVIRTSFTSEGPFEFHGEFYDFDGAVMDLQPGKGGTPEIWLAAHGPRMLRLTGQYADGWYPAIPMTPDEYDDRLATIRAAAVSAHRNPDSIVAGINFLPIIGASDEEARAMLDHPAIRFLSLLIPAYVWESRGVTHPLADDHGGLVDLIPQERTAAEWQDVIDSVSGADLEDILLWGTPDRIVAHLRQLGQAGMQHVVLAPASGLVSRKAAAYAVRALAGITKRLQRGED